MVFLSLILFIFAVFGVELIGRNRAFGAVKGSQDFEYMMPAVMTLFQVMTLDEWLQTVQPFLDAEPWTYGFWLLFIGVAALAMMNLVTAVVVESSVKRTTQDSDYQQALFDHEVALIAEEYSELFDALEDEDVEELAVLLGDEGD